LGKRHRINRGPGKVRGGGGGHSVRRVANKKGGPLGRVGEKYTSITLKRGNWPITEQGRRGLGRAATGVSKNGAGPPKKKKQRGKLRKGGSVCFGGGKKLLKKGG